MEESLSSRSNSSKKSGGRIPPQDLNAEKSLLGAILLSDTAFPDILEIVKSKDFYEERHSKIFHAMTSLYQHHSPIDLTTTVAQLRKEKNLRSAGGENYIIELSNFVLTPTHASAYAELVKNASLRRSLIKAGSVIVESGFEEGKEIGEVLGAAEKELYSVTNTVTKSEYVPLGSLLADAFERMEELHRNKGALRGLKTGFRDLDKKTAGFQKGDLIIIGARPAMGKTTFAENIAYNVSTMNNRGVLFFSMEMSSAEIVDRIVSDVSGVNNWNIRTGNITEEDYVKITDAYDEMDSVPLYIDDTSSMNILELRNKARRAAHDHDIGLIIIDYLQLIQGTDRYAGNRVQEVTEISRGLKQLARELEIPIVALAQLSRNVTGRDDPRPILSDLRESGSIEQDADLVMFLHRIDYYNQNKPDYVETNITELIIAKHRHGPVGKIELYFHPELLRFMTLDKEHTEE